MEIQVADRIMSKDSCYYRKMIAEQVLVILNSCEESSAGLTPRQRTVTSKKLQIKMENC